MHASLAIRSSALSAPRHNNVDKRFHGNQFANGPHDHGFDNLHGRLAALLTLTLLSRMWQWPEFTVYRLGSTPQYCGITGNFKHSPAASAVTFGRASS